MPIVSNGQAMDQLGCSEWPLLTNERRQKGGPAAGLRLLGGPAAGLRLLTAPGNVEGPAEPASQPRKQSPRGP